MGSSHVPCGSGLTQAGGEAWYSGQPCSPLTCNMHGSGNEAPNRTICEAESASAQELQCDLQCQGAL